MHKERDAEGFTGSGDESGYLQLGAHDKNQLNVRVTDQARHRLEQLKGRFDRSYGQLVEAAINELWTGTTLLKRGLLRSGDFNNMEVRIDRWGAEGNQDYAIHLFREYFGQLWDTLKEAMDRLEKAGIELPLER